MIELTERQRQAIQEHQGGPVELTDPATKETFVLIRRELYERLADYDDSPWTDEEMDALAWEAGKHAGWDDMGEYDEYPNKP
jgi:hypothetical protein